MLPNFLIIGAPKAGTTALAAFLAAHPEVYVAPEKEVHFFDEHLARGTDWYRTRFDSARDEIAVGEATPTYMYSDEALERMADLLPEAKLIVVLRDPVDRAYSHYWWMRALFESLSFEDAVHAEMAEGSGKRLYLAGGRYLDRLQAVCRLYPRSSVHVVIQEELRRSPDATFAGVCRFLGVDARRRPANVGAVLNPAYRLRWPWLRRVMFRIHAWDRISRRIADRIDHWNRVPFAYPPMSPQIRAELERYFVDHNAALAAWLGRDLLVWGSRAAS